MGINMGLKRASQWLNRIALIAGIVLSILLMFFIYQIDHMVNSQLYDYNLLFSSVWFDPYKLLTIVIYTSIGAIMVLSGLSLVLGLKVSKNEGSGSAKTMQPQVQLQSISSAIKEQDIDKSYISCPHCKKVFSKPIVMLNFEGGKTRLVNICPHCNHTLGNAEEETDKNGNIIQKNKL